MGTLLDRPEVLTLSYGQFVRYLIENNACGQGVHLVQINEWSALECWYNLKRPNYLLWYISKIVSNENYNTVANAFFDSFPGIKIMRNMYTSDLVPHYSTYPPVDCPEEKCDWLRDYFKDEIPTP